MNYKEFFGLKEEPFAMTSNPKCFYKNDPHMDALTRVKQGIDSSKSFCVFIGDPGTGKTFISRKILEILQNEEDKYRASLLVIINREISIVWLLKRIALSLGIEFPGEEKAALTAQIKRKLVQIDDTGKKTVILIDEAQLFREKEIYEELKSLLNIEAGDHKLLNIVLFGPPELEKNLRLDPELVSKIGLKIILKPLDHKASSGYISHRLAISGAGKEIFSPEARKAVYQSSRGVPRLINIISDNSLLEGFLMNKKEIGPDIVRAAAETLGIKKFRNKPLMAADKDRTGINMRKKTKEWNYTSL